LCEEANIAQMVALETNEIIIAGNMTKLQAGISSSKYGAVIPRLSGGCGAAYLGSGVKHFREEVAAGRLPARERYGERLIWDKRVFDHHVNKDNSRHPRSE